MARVMSVASVLRITVAAASGALLALLAPPVNLYWLHWVAYLPMFWLLHPDQPRRNRWLGVVYGTVAVATIFSWLGETIILFSNIPSIGAWAIVLVFSMIFGLPYVALWMAVHPLRKRLGDGWMLAVPAWLVVVEFVSMYVLLFPYQQGVSQYRVPSLVQLVSVTGVWGLSFLLMFVNCTLAEGLYRWREGRRELPMGWMTSGVAVVAVVAIFGSYRFDAIERTLQDADTIRVAQIQSSVTMSYRLARDPRETFDYWFDQTLRFEPGVVDLVVWPEGASPYSLNEGEAPNVLWDLVRDGDFELVVGGGTREREADPTMGERERIRVFNSVYFFDRNGVATSSRSVREQYEDLVRDGCDLEQAGVSSAWEASVLGSVPIALGGGEVAADVAALLRQDGGWFSQGNGTPNLELTDEKCSARLLARASVYEQTENLPADFVRRIRGDWGLFQQLRGQTSIASPLEHHRVSKMAYAINWELREQSCGTLDCPGVVVRCDVRGACAVYPSPVHYDKMVPLPFGEYVPFSESFPWIADLIQGPGDFRGGTEAVVFEGETIRFSTPICYEGTLPSLCRSFDRPDVLINVTNDGWFGHTSASVLHGMLVALRATELGIPVFRGAFTGISMVVEPHGNIYAETPLFTEIHRVVPIRLGRVWTLYGAWGDWFVLVCAIGLGAGMWRTRDRRQRSCD